MSQRWNARRHRQYDMDENARRERERQWRRQGRRWGVETERRLRESIYGTTDMNNMVNVTCIGDTRTRWVQGPNYADTHSDPYDSVHATGAEIEETGRRIVSNYDSVWIHDGDQPERLRGINHDQVILDEASLWEIPEGIRGEMGPDDSGIAGVSNINDGQLWGRTVPNFTFGPGDWTTESFVRNNSDNNWHHIYVDGAIHATKFNENVEFKGDVHCRGDVIIEGNIYVEGTIHYGKEISKEEKEDIEELLLENKELEAENVRLRKLLKIHGIRYDVYSNDDR